MSQFWAGIDILLSQVADFWRWCTTPVNTQGLGFLFNLDITPVGQLMNHYVWSNSPIMIFFSGFIAIVTLRLIFGFIRLINVVE